MKQTKRCLGLLLAVIMAFTALPVGAAFSDVTEDLPQLEAVEVLSGLGLIAGYTEGGETLFKPEGQITRAEFTAMLTRALKLAEIGAIATTPFDDVAADHWASANIRIAYDMGIILGYDAKTFGPEDSVTYEQAIKMMVCALGFGDQAIARGGYPNGYVNVALDKKLLGKVGGTGDKPATRADIAQMIYNAFHVDIAIEDGVKADGTPNYVITSGKTLLTEKLELDHIEGQVTGINMTRLDSGEGVSKKNCIEVDGVAIVVPEETDQSALLGRKVEVYYETNESNGVKTAQFIYQAAGDNLTVTVSYDKIMDAGNNELIYEGADGEDVSLEYDDLKMIYNKKQINGQPEDVLNIRSGEITFLDADGDENYDVAFVSEYRILHVNRVDTVNYDVTDFKSGKKETFEPTKEDSGNQLKIYKDGKEVAFSTIRNRTTLCIYESKNTSGDLLTEIHLSQKSVRGKIQKISHGKYTISGNEYGVSYYYNSDELSLGQESTFYLDLENNIVDTAAVALAGTKLYGYLIDVRYDDTEEKVTLKVLPAGEDTPKTFECTDSVVVDSVQLKSHETIRDQLSDSAQNTNKDGGTNTTYSQLIMYGVSGEKINAINTTAQRGSEDYNTNLTVFSSGGQYTGLYDASKKRFDFNSGITINANTKIFVVPTDRASTSEYTTAINLKDGKEYTVEAFEKSSVGVAGAVVIYGGIKEDTIAVDAPLYIVSSELESMINEEDESIVRIPVMNVQTGATSTVDVTASDPVVASVKKGALIRFAKNSDGTIRKGLLELLFDPNSERKPKEEREKEDTSAFVTRYGAAYSIETDTKELWFTTVFPGEETEDEERELYSYGSAKIYVYDTIAEKEEERIVAHSTTTSNILYARSISVVPVGTQPSTIFLHLSEGKVKFIYIVR